MKLLAGLGWLGAPGPLAPAADLATKVTTGLGPSNNLKEFASSFLLPD
jgi:hypothetical protein